MRLLRSLRKCVIIGMVVFVSAVATWFFAFVVGNSRVRAEREHGVSLPSSARHIQCKGDEWCSFFDRGLATTFEMSTNDLGSFVAQLRIRSRSAPARTSGDPTVNDWNVWPQRSATFFPGNGPYGGFRHTWDGDAVPVEMLSCSSPTGDWLHVELWKLKNRTMLVKMYTDWN